MSEKKHTNFNNSDVNKMQAVRIDEKTTIYIALNADPEEARLRFLARFKHKTIIQP